MVVRILAREMAFAYRIMLSIHVGREKTVQIQSRRHRSVASDQCLHYLSNQQVVEWTVQLFLIIPSRQADQQQTVILAEEPTYKGCASVDSEGPDQPA